MTILSLVGAASSAASLEYKIVFEMLGVLLPPPPLLLLLLLQSLLQSLPLRLYSLVTASRIACGFGPWTVPRD